MTDDECPDCEGELQVEYAGRWSGRVCQDCGLVIDEDSALEHEEALAAEEGEVEELEDGCACGKEDCC